MIKPLISRRGFMKCAATGLLLPPVARSMGLVPASGSKYHPEGTPPDPESTLISFDQFESSAPAYWTLGAVNGATYTRSTDTSLNYAGSSGSLRGQYPTLNDVGCYSGYEGDFGNTMFVRFRAKMPSAHKDGLKFWKVFGGDGPGGVANCTFGLDYTGIERGGMMGIYYGDGTTANNDTQNGLLFTGEVTTPNRSSGTLQLNTPMGEYWGADRWGTDWHKFEFGVKFNSVTTSGNEVPDGEFIIKIDDELWLHATDLFNRHYSNPDIVKVEIFGHTNSSAPFEICYDNIEVCTGAFGSSPV
jgi:hypothetical protein